MREKVQAVAGTRSRNRRVTSRDCSQLRGARRRLAERRGRALAFRRAGDRRLCRSRVQAVVAHGFRREPKQRRSREVVGAILEAVDRLIPQYELQLTTKKVAEIAGVSIGSLYQYFPTKKSLFSTWAHGVLRESLADLSQLFDAAEARPIADVLRDLVDVAIEARARRPAVTRAVMGALFGSRNDELTREIDAQLLPQLAKVLRDHAHETRPLNADLAAFILLYSIRWVLIAASTVPGLLQEQLLRDELIHLSAAYVSPRVVVETP